MAKSRKISQDLISDEEYNSMSIEAQLIFIRLLAVSDDCGVVPAGEYTLNTLIAPPEKLRSKIMAVVGEIVAAGLGKIVDYKGKKYFLFKPTSFREHQSYIFNKRHKSEYLKISAAEFDELNLWESNADQLKVNCESTDDQLQPDCEAMGGIRYKVQGIRNKEKEAQQKTEVAPGVTVTENEHKSLIDKIGEEKAKRCYMLLSDYKQAHGKKYKSDAAAIRQWVISAIDEQDTRGKPKKQPKQFDSDNPPPFLN